MKRISFQTLALSACLLAVLIGCVRLQPGADPLIVNAERTEVGAIAAFDLVLSIDQANRPFWKTNAPPFHQFCEWLRAPQVVRITNTVPRGVALVLSLQQVKEDYRAAKTSSNAVIVAMSTLSSAVNQAAAWLVIVTNQPTLTP